MDQNSPYWVRKAHEMMRAVQKYMDFVEAEDIKQRGYAVCDISAEGLKKWKDDYMIGVYGRIAMERYSETMKKLWDMGIVPITGEYYDGPDPRRIVSVRGWSGPVPKSTDNPYLGTQPIFKHGKP